MEGRKFKGGRKDGRKEGRKLMKGGKKEVGEGRKEGS
jgi:hypothetical protein